MSQWSESSSTSAAFLRPLVTLLYVITVLAYTKCMSSIAILGRQPALGRAELESLLGSEAIVPVGSNSARIQLNQTEIPAQRLGGTTKLAKELNTLETTDWTQIEQYLRKNLPHHLGYIPNGKIKLGVSTYGLKVAPETINRSALSLKQTIKKHGRSSRIIANKATELNTAQVLHGGLLSPVGIELLLISDGVKTILAQTYWVQDINAYADRDQKRPKRDRRVGMLPPKLAQIIINLASAAQIPPDYGAQVLDPFCGTGVVLQEASLMGYDIVGSDLEPRMVEYSRENLLWLAHHNRNLTVHDPSGEYFGLEVADATTADFPSFNFIACETYLGRPFSHQPEPQILREVINDCNQIHKKFLQNVNRQTKPGFRMCIAVPAWSTKSGFKHLPILDSLEELGYNRHKFVHVSTKDLIYHRPDQIVARELVVITRK